MEEARQDRGATRELRKGGVARELEVLSKQLDDLTDSIGTLESLLSPALRKDCRENCPSETAEVTSELAGMIRNASERLSRNIEMVKVLQDRVDL